MKWRKRSEKTIDLAIELWVNEYHEAKILAVLIDEPKKITPIQMDKMVEECDSWDLTDACCGNLFDKTPFAYQKAKEWMQRPEEFVRTGGIQFVRGIICSR